MHLIAAITVHKLFNLYMTNSETTPRKQQTINYIKNENVCCARFRGHTVPGAEQSQSVKYDEYLVRK